MHVMHNTLGIADCEAMDVYNLSLSNAAWSYCIEAPSIVKLLNQGQTITAVATIMYSPVTLQQVIPSNIRSRM